jgi:hypothetical protein
MLQLLVAANVVPSLLIIFILMIEVICYVETLVLRRTTQCHIAEDDILHSHHCENLLSHKYVVLS